MKIASKALALRLEKILPEITQADQYAYAKEAERSSMLSAPLTIS